MTTSTTEPSLYPPLPTDGVTIRRLQHWRARSLPSPPTSRFLHFYYLILVATILLYLPLRCIVWPSWINPNIAPAADLIDSEKRECHMFVLLLILLFSKWRRSFSTEMLVTHILRFSRFAVCASSFIADSYLCALMVGLFLFVWMVGPSEPCYAGPSNVRSIDASFFHQRIDSTNADPHLTYIVRFSTNRHENGRCFLSEFARTSCHYGYDGSSVVFVSIDLDRYSTLSKKFQIDVVSWGSEDIPTVMMFQEGKVRARLPERGRRTLLTETSMVRAFNLDHLARVPPDVLTQVQKRRAGHAK